MNNQHKSAFELLHPAIQEELYRMGWTELRPIQVEAIHNIFNNHTDLIISAMTAGGKTEAAFLPILSDIVEDFEQGIRVLYVGPLKALINDQFRRLEDLCERTDIPVFRWHGDVGQAPKKDLLKKPSGVLLITPESIESLFVNHPSHLSKLFGLLKYVVIDEMHSFMGTERGAHLKSLLSRIYNLSKYQVRTVGLSATIGDIELAQTWLSPKNAGNINIIRDPGEKDIRYLIKGYLRGHDSNSITTEDYSCETIETPDDIRLTEDIIKSFFGTTALIFANSRALLEFYSDLVRRLLERRNLPNLLRVHHGSLSKAEREETEEALRSDRPTIAFCSSTLEMGIDVGNVKAIGQIGAPWTVNSLTQRLGRSGRKENEPSIMWVYIQDDEPDQNTRLIDRLFPQLLQAIAVTDLMLKKWCEPPDVKRLHLSTFIQQIMSVIAFNGGSTALKLYDVLVSKGSFSNIDKNTFVQVLRDMGRADLIEQTPDNELILGLTGERITRSYDFYSAFQTTRELRVVHSGHEIGSIMSFPGMSEDSYIILAGRRWKIVTIDIERLVIEVEPSFGGRLPKFSGVSGPDIHPKVRETMKQVLLSGKTPEYLDKKAKEMLSMAQATAFQAGLSNQPIVTDGLDLIWFTWTGTRINRTIWGLAKYFANFDVEDNGIAITFRRTDDIEFTKWINSIINEAPSIDELASRFAVKSQEKYDGYLSEELQSYIFARNDLDLEGALMVINSLISNASQC